MTRLFSVLRLLATQVLMISIVTLLLLELMLIFSFRHPSLSPIPIPILQHLHILFVRNTIQVMPECARYDQSLTYTLRPGTCVFSNSEYSNHFSINSLGVRDTEDSLRAPETVVLGDSIAMGWGVEQDEAFPKVYERMTGSRTLNAGISSYGTARELLLLERIDRSNLRHLIIQYHENDYGENREFAGDDWQTLSKEQYHATISRHAEMQRYFPGKHSINLLVQIRNLLGAATREQPETSGRSPSRHEEAATFLQVLELSPVDLQPYEITVVALDSSFIAAARELAMASQSSLLSRLRFIDAQPAEDISGSFYLLDDHPTAVGHHAIARLLAEPTTQ